MKKYPKILNVETLEGKRLKVLFEGNVIKIYDCTPLLTEDTFKPLEDDALFKNVHADEGGYGIVWNDYLDLSESELWENGSRIN